jgi:hypothetical protein
VIRNKDGEFEIGDLQVQGLDEQEEEGHDAQEDESMWFAQNGWLDANMSAEERQRLVDAVKHHQRDRNRAPSEPAG